MARIATLKWQLAIANRVFKYVGYAQAEIDCEILADKLRDRFGQDVTRFRYAAIPRGGLIVLGMLSYVLGLYGQIDSRKGRKKTLVVVDDCALSGLRFREYLQSRKEPEVIFAVLYSHPALRSAIEQRESRVAACVSAHDLQDYAPELFGDRYFSWKQRWESRSDEYWVGQPDHVSFAWNEPDLSFWNESTGRVEAGWHLLPPEQCLKRRNHKQLVPVQVMDEAESAMRVSENVLVAELNDRLLVANLLTKKCFQLSDVATTMWRTLAVSGNIRSAAQVIASHYSADPSMIEQDLRVFIRGLEDQALLRKEVGSFVS